QPAARSGMRFTSNVVLNTVAINAQCAGTASELAFGSGRTLVTAAKPEQDAAHKPHQCRLTGFVRAVNRREPCLGKGQLQVVPDAELLDLDIGDLHGSPPGEANRCRQQARTGGT